MCKAYYCELLKNEMESYEQVENVLTDGLMKTNKELKFPKITGAVPYLYGIFKLHKIPDIRLRWIAGTSVNCETLIEETNEPDKETDESKKVTNTRERVFRSNVMTHAQQELTGIIKLILLTLKSKDHMEYVKTGVRKYFIVDSVDEVIQRIKSNYPEFLKYAEPKTYDFTTMYSNLKHKVLKRNCKEAVDEAFRFSGKKHIARNSRARGKSKTFFFTDGVDANTKEYTSEMIGKLIDMCIDYSLIQPIGSHQCYRQTKGIPMGGNASPLLANLYCYAVEKKFIEQSTLEIAKSHTLTVRYIDDFLCWGTKPPPQKMYGMDYKDTSLDSNDVVFLGARIRVEEDIAREEVKVKKKFIRLSVHRKEWNFKPLQYVHADSTMPDSIPKGIVKGAMYRASMICNNLSDLLIEFEWIIYRMITRKFKKHHISTGYKEFCDEFYEEYPFVNKRCINLFYRILEGLKKDYYYPTGERNYITYPPIEKDEIETDRTAVLVQKLSSPTNSDAKVNLGHLDELVSYFTFRDMKTLLETMDWDLTIPSVNTAGNCFFESMALIICQNGVINAEWVRRVIHRRLTLKKAQYQSFVDTDYEKFTEDVLDSNTYTDHVYIQAFLDEMGCSLILITINSVQEKSLRWISPASTQDTYFWGTIGVMAYHTTSEHYMPILPRSHGKQCTIFTMSQWNYEAFMNLIVPELAKMCPNFVDADTLLSKAGATMNLLTFDNVNYDVYELLHYWYFDEIKMKAATTMSSCSDLTSETVSVTSSDSSSSTTSSSSNTIDEELVVDVLINLLEDSDILIFKEELHLCPARHNLKFAKVSSNMYCNICDRNMPQTTYNLAFQCRQKDCDYDVCLSCLGLFICTACGATESQAGRQFNLRGLRSHQTHCTVFREQSERS